MREFKDSEGRIWRPRITGAVIIRFEMSSSINLLEALHEQVKDMALDDIIRTNEEGKQVANIKAILQLLTGILGGRVSNLIRLAYVSCITHAEKEQRMTFEEFAGALDADTLGDAATAVGGALSDFFQSLSGQMKISSPAVQPAEPDLGDGETSTKSPPSQE